VDTLVEMLTYKCGDPDWVQPATHDGVKVRSSPRCQRLKIEPCSHTSMSCARQVYSPPVEEFMVSAVSVHGTDDAAVLPACDSFGLVLIYDGEGTVEVSSSSGQQQQVRVSKGQVYGLAAGHNLRVTAAADGGIALFKANANCERAAAASSRPSPSAL
jgi:mannose-6-phosphate isomerase class I